MQIATFRPPDAVFDRGYFEGGWFDVPGQHLDPVCHLPYGMPDKRAIHAPLPVMTEAYDESVRLVNRKLHHAVVVLMPEESAQNNLAVCRQIVTSFSSLCFILCFLMAGCHGQVLSF